RFNGVPIAVVANRRFYAFDDQFLRQIELFHIKLSTKNDDVTRMYPFGNRPLRFGKSPTLRQGHGIALAGRARGEKPDWAFHQPPFVAGEEFGRFFAPLSGINRATQYNSVVLP